MQQLQQLESDDKNANQVSRTKFRRPNKLEDDLAVVAIFIALGVIFHFFALDTNTPSWDNFYQFLSYLCYAISFFGGAVGIEQHSKKEAFSDVGFGVACGIIAYWLHTGVMNLRNTNTVWTIIVEIIFMIFVAITAYGLVRGIIRMVIYPKQEPTIVAESTKPSGNIRRERVVGFFIAFLSLLFGFIQALPIIIEYIKTICNCSAPLPPLGQKPQKG